MIRSKRRTINQSFYIGPSHLLVSPGGEVWKEGANGRWNLLKQRKRGKGKYMAITVNKQSHYVHRIVAYAFGIYPSLQKVMGFDVDHIDNNHLNNSVSNLRMIPRQLNRNKEHENILSKLDYVYVAEKVLENSEVIVCRSLGEMADALNVDKSFVSLVARGKRKQCSGYTVKKISKEEFYEKDKNENI